MARALALTAESISLHAGARQLELLRRALLRTCAAALILAGKSLPF